MLTQEQMFEAWEKNDPTEWLHADMDNMGKQISVGIYQKSLQVVGRVLWHKEFGCFYFRLDSIQRPKMRQYLDDAFFSTSDYESIIRCFKNGFGFKACKGIHCEHNQEYGHITFFGKKSH